MNSKKMIIGLASVSALLSYPAVNPVSAAEVNTNEAKTVQSDAQHRSIPKSQEVTIEEMVRKIGFFPTTALHHFDNDLYTHYNKEIWPKGASFYPFPVSPKLQDMDFSDSGAKSANLQGLNVLNMKMDNPFPIFTVGKPIYFGVANFENKTSRDQTYQTLEYTEKLIESRTITKNDTLKVGNETSLTTELDVLGLGGVEATTKITVEGTWSNTDTEMKQYEKTLRVPPMNVLVPAGKGVRVEAEVLKGEIKDALLRATAVTQGSYTINNGYHDYKGDIYGFLKTLQRTDSSAFWSITQGRVEFDDILKTTTFKAIGLLSGDVISTSYRVLLVEYDLKTGDVTKRTPIKTLNMK